MLNEIPLSFLWLILAVILIIIEASTQNLITIWFAIGALFAVFAALIKIPLYFQLVVFVIVSAILLYFTKPIVNRFLKVKKERTNADKIIGEKGIVIEKIDPLKSTGQVKVGGLIWTARSEDGTQIDVDEVVEVKEISGVKIIVKSINKTI